MAGKEFKAKEKQLTKHQADMSETSFDTPQVEDMKFGRDKPKSEISEIPTRRRRSVVTEEQSSDSSEISMNNEYSESKTKMNIESGSEENSYHSSHNDKEYFNFKDAEHENRDNDSLVKPKSDDFFIRNEQNVPKADITKSDFELRKHDDLHGNAEVPIPNKRKSRMPLSEKETLSTDDTTVFSDNKDSHIQFESEGKSEVFKENKVRNQLKNHSAASEKLNEKGNIADISVSENDIQKHKVKSLQKQMFGKEAESKEKTAKTFDNEVTFHRSNANKADVIKPVESVKLVKTEAVNKKKPVANRIAEKRNKTNAINSVTSTAVSGINEAVIAVDNVNTIESNDNSDGSAETLAFAENSMQSVFSFTSDNVRKTKLREQSVQNVKTEKLKFDRENFKIKAHQKQTKLISEESNVKSASKAAMLKAQRKSYQKKAQKSASKAAKNAEKAAEETVKGIVNFATGHPWIIVIIIIVFLLFATIGTCCSTVGVIGSDSTGKVLFGTYSSAESDMLAAEEYMSSLEEGLKQRISNIPSEYPGYNEYRFNIAGIGHNPYQLISFLTAAYPAFKIDEVRGAIDSYFNAMYDLSAVGAEEKRKVQYTYKDSEGNTHTGYKTITIKVLYVTLSKNEPDSIAGSMLNDKQYAQYELLNATKGNYPELFLKKEE